jgi:hypothetical protein
VGCDVFVFFSINRFKDKHQPIFFISFK